MKAWPRSTREVVIVGSGPTGMVVADLMRHQGIRPLVLEAGSRVDEAANRLFPSMADYRAFVAPAWQVDTHDWAYETDRDIVDWLRVRAVGGRSLRWRGWLARPKPENFTLHTPHRGKWPFTPAELEPLLLRAADWLNAREGTLDPRFQQLAAQLGEHVVPKIAASSADGIRPFLSLDPFITTAGTTSDRGFDLHDRCVATRVLCEANQTWGIEYLDRRAGRLKRIRTRAVVLAASPIETTRLLLGAGIASMTDAYPHIGQHYLDHIAASYLAVLPMRFDGAPVGGLLERSAILPSPSGCTPEVREAFGSFTIELHGPNPASIHEPEILVAAGLDPLDDANRACISVNAIGELTRSRDRRVTLSPRRDSLGRRIPNLNVGWNAVDQHLARAMEQEAQRVAAALAGPAGYTVRARQTLTLGGTGTSHEAGTCPIGVSDADSVVNLDGQVHGITGLFVADASLMPTSLDCHPTLTAVALALHAARGVARHLERTTPRSWHPIHPQRRI